MVTLPRRSVGPERRLGAVGLPGVENVGQVRAPSDPGVRVPEGAFGGMGEGLQEAAAGLSDFAESVRAAGEKQQNRFDFTKTNEALQDYELATMEEFQKRQVEDDPSRPDFMKDFGEFVDERGRQTISNLPEGLSEDALAKLQIKIRSRAIALRESAGRLSIQASQEKAADVWSQRLNTFSAQARQNPDFLDTHLEEAFETLEGFAPNMTAGQKRDAGLQAQQEIVQAAVDGELGRANFDKARDLLMDERFVDVFDEKTRGALTARIDTAEVREEDRRVKMIDRAEKKAKEAAMEQSDTLTKQGIALAASDELTPEWVLERQEVLDLEDFRSLMKAADAPEGEDDRVVVADMYERIADGEDVERAAIEAFTRGDLKRETMNTIVSRNETIQGKVGAKTPFQRASTFLKNALRPSELNDNPDAAAAYANAEADMMSFFDENPQAGVKQAMDYARELASSYRLAPGTVLSLPFPNWMQGDRASKQPNLDETETRLIEDLAQGRINQDEARRRAAVINRWREFFDQQGAN